MRKYERNVRLAESSTRRRGLERVLIHHPVVNRVMAWAAQLVLTALIWPRFVAPYRWELTRYDVPLEGLGAGLEGYRILQLTDLHVGRTRVSYLERAIDGCVAEKPDLIVLTGDLIDYHPRSLGPVGLLLKRIVAGAGREGVCAIFGNHDYHEYSWRHIGARSARRTVHRRLVKIVEDAGVRLLRNEQLRITRGEGGVGGGVTLVGMDEMWTGRADAAAAFRGLTAGDAVICLQHNPDGIEFLLAHPWQFMMCGHSHGGQAHFPGLGALYVPMVHREYLRGFFRFPGLNGSGRVGGERVMFVSRGLGHTTPIRMGCAPEATVFTLRSQRGTGATELNHEDTKARRI